MAFLYHAGMQATMEADEKKTMVSRFVDASDRRSRGKDTFVPHGHTQII